MIAVSPIDVSKNGMMMLNNSVSLLPMALLLAFAGEWRQWGLLRELSVGQLALLVASCVNAVAISWAGINCQAYVTATTFMVLSNLNKFVVIGFGILALHETKSLQDRMRSNLLSTCCRPVTRRTPPAVQRSRRHRRRHHFTPAMREEDDGHVRTTTLVRCDRPSPAASSLLEGACGTAKRGRVSPRVPALRRK